MVALSCTGFARFASEFCQKQCLRLPGMKSEAAGMALTRLWALMICLTPTFAIALECKPIAFNDIHASVCTVDVRTDHLRLFVNDAAGKPFNTFKRLSESLQQQGEELGFAMNAGMYREDYSPLGLFVADGQQVRRLNMASGYGSF